MIVTMRLCPARDENGTWTPEAVAALVGQRPDGDLAEITGAWIDRSDGWVHVRGVLRDSAAALARPTPPGDGQ